MHHSLHYLSRANQKRVREFLEPGGQDCTRRPPSRAQKTLQQRQLLWVDLGCRLFKRSRKTFALSLALFGPFWDLHYSSYLLYQLWGSESKLAAPTWPPCEAMSTGVLSRTAKLLGGWTNSCGRDGWANAWAVQSD